MMICVVSVLSRGSSPTEKTLSVTLNASVWLLCLMTIMSPMTGTCCSLGHGTCVNPLVLTVISVFIKRIPFPVSVRVDNVSEMDATA